MKTSKEIIDKAYGHIPKEVNLSYSVLEEPLFPKLNSIIRLIKRTLTNISRIKNDG